MLVLKVVLICFCFLYATPPRSVLSQAKQKTPLILPGFEAIDAPDDCSGQYTVRSVFRPAQMIVPTVM